MLYEVNKVKDVVKEGKRLERDYYWFNKLPFKKDGFYGNKTYFNEKQYEEDLKEYENSLKLLKEVLNKNDEYKDISERLTSICDNKEGSTQDINMVYLMYLEMVQRTERDFIEQLVENNIPFETTNNLKYKVDYLKESDNKLGNLEKYKELFGKDGYYQLMSFLFKYNEFIYVKNKFEKDKYQLLKDANGSYFMGFIPAYLKDYLDKQVHRTIIYIDVFAKRKEKYINKKEMPRVYSEIKERIIREVLTTALQVFGKDSVIIYKGINNNIGAEIVFSTSKEVTEEDKNCFYKEFNKRVENSTIYDIKRFSTYELLITYNHETEKVIYTADEE